MGLTLVEASKLNSGDVLKSTVIETFARESDILRVLPFDDVQGGGITYNREAMLPGIAFRGVNESYAVSAGVVNPQTDQLVICGGDVDVDRFIIQTRGQAVRGQHTMMKIKALAATWTTSFLKGDSTVDPRQFDGLQKRLQGSQVISANVASGGGALSLQTLDQAIDQCSKPTHILMSKAMRRRIQAAARNTAVGGYVTYSPDEFGRRSPFYNDLPLIVAYDDNGGDEVLPFSEAYSGGGTANGTSIYILSLGNGMLSGIQNGVMDVRDLGELQTAPSLRTRVEWYAAISLQHPRAAVRLRDIQNAAVVA